MGEKAKGRPQFDYSQAYNYDRLFRLHFDRDSTQSDDVKLLE